MRRPSIDTLLLIGRRVLSFECNSTQVLNVDGTWILSGDERDWAPPSRTNLPCASSLATWILLKQRLDLIPCTIVFAISTISVRRELNAKAARKSSAQQRPQNGPNCAFSWCQRAHRVHPLRETSPQQSSKEHSSS